MLQLKFYDCKLSHHSQFNVMLKILFQCGKEFVPLKPKYRPFDPIFTPESLSNQHNVIAKKGTRGVGGWLHCKMVSIFFSPGPIEDFNLENFYILVVQSNCNFLDKRSHCLILHSFLHKFPRALISHLSSIQGSPILTQKIPTKTTLQCTVPPCQIQASIFFFPNPKEK